MCANTMSNSNIKWKNATSIKNQNTFISHMAENSQSKNTMVYKCYNIKQQNFNTNSKHLKHGWKKPIDVS